MKTLSAAFIGALASIPLAAPQSETLQYINGPYTVDVLFEYINPPLLDNKKCATFVSGKDEYTTACFTSTFNERDIFLDCEIEFDGTVCEFCDVCVVQPGAITGIQYDCRNIEPGESNPFTCVALTNQTIQEIIVDEFFTNQPFAFNLEVQDPVGSGGSTDNPENDSGTAITSISLAGAMVLATCFL